MKMNRILVPYDFSDVSACALNFAGQIAQRSRAEEVLLLNVVEHPSESRLKFMGATELDPLENVYFSKLIQLVKNKMEDHIAKVDFDGVDFKYKIQLGSPYNTLIDEVAEEAVDLVVMGTSGSEGMDELFVGSNAERVVRSAKCPVISMKEPTDIKDIHDLVFASNFVDLKPGFVEKVKNLQEMLDAKLRIVKINTPANFTTNRHDLSLMNDFVKKYDVKDYTVDIYNYTNEEDGIIYFAEDIDADMIAIGTNQRTGFDHFLLGSIAEDVVNHSKRPVWTLDLES